MAGSVVSPGRWQQYEEGDFTGGGRFNANDLVSALASGTYGHGPFAL